MIAAPAVLKGELSCVVVAADPLPVPPVTAFDAILFGFLLAGFVICFDFITRRDP